MLLTNSSKTKHDVLTETLMKELSKRKKSNQERQIEQEMSSDEIARIISDRLLENIQSKIVL